MIIHHLDGWWTANNPVLSAGTIIDSTDKRFCTDAQKTSIGLIGYTIPVQGLTSSPVDAQTIFFGTIPRAPTVTAATSKCYVRGAGTIKRVEIYCFSGTAGTNEAWSLYIRKNNTTDTLIATVSLATGERIFSNAALNIAMADGDYFEIKSVNPTWVTNPLTTVFGGFVFIG